MKRIFSRKRRDYRLYAAATAFGFIAALTTIFTAHPSLAPQPVIQQQAAVQTKDPTVAFAYASPNANASNLGTSVTAAPTSATADAIFQPIEKTATAAPLQPINKPVQSYIADGKAAPAASLTENVAIGKGDTLGDVFASFSIPSNLAASAVDSLKGIFSTKNFRVGQQITLLFRPTNDGRREFRGYRFAADPLRDVIVLDAKGKGDFDASVVNKQLYTVTAAKHGKITGSLVGAAERAGVPYPVVQEMIKVFSYNVDFQRDIQEGDSFDVMYEAKADKDGHVYGAGDMVYARLILSGKEYPVYRFDGKDGSSEYFKADGTSIKRGLIRTPVDGARITSGFGFRIHPLLGYNKMHKGVDFGAPKGTPIYAAGDGFIAKAGWVRGYGNYIKIQHNGKLATAYGHMNAFAANIHTGTRVKQGQVIGYVGMTGDATGPHLHYEVLVDNTQVNPVGVNVPTSRQLAGAEMNSFKKSIGQLSTAFKTALAKSSNEVASR